MKVLQNEIKIYAGILVIIVGVDSKNEVDQRKFPKNKMPYSSETDEHLDETIYADMPMAFGLSDYNSYDEWMKSSTRNMSSEETTFKKTIPRLKEVMIPAETVQRGDIPVEYVDETTLLTLQENPATITQSNNNSVKNYKKELKVIDYNHDNSTVSPLLDMIVRFIIRVKREKLETPREE